MKVASSLQQPTSQPELSEAVVEHGAHVARRVQEVLVAHAAQLAPVHIEIVQGHAGGVDLVHVHHLLQPLPHLVFAPELGLALARPQTARVAAWHNHGP